MKESFEVVGTVAAVLVATKLTSHISTSVDSIDVLINKGVRRDKHAGRRLLDVREGDLLKFGLPKRIEIANHRQFSAISIEEMAEVAEALRIPSITPGLLGENLIVSGIPNFTKLPFGTKLFIKKNGVPQTAVLIVWGENIPCAKPGKAIAEKNKGLTTSAGFIKHAMGKRGIVGSVYSSGVISVGDTIIAKIPKQTIYEPPQT